MGGNALNGATASTRKWDAGDYVRVGGFVPALGLAAVNLLDPQPGERILDVGCGDGAFSNAALHWMLDKARVAAAVFNALHFGGRFAGEMGGEGNIAILRGGIRAALEERGYPVPPQDPQWDPSVDEFRAVYEA